MTIDFHAIAKTLQDEAAINKAFLQYLHSEFDDKPIDLITIVHELAVECSNHVDCTECGNCCKKTIMVTPEDLRRLSTGLSIPEDEFKEKYLQRKDDVTWCFASRPCVFLENKMCRAYESRPEACRRFPYLDLDYLCVNRRGFPVEELLAFSSACPIIFNILQELKKRLRFSADTYRLTEDVHIRMELELRSAGERKASSLGLTFGQYICDLLKNDQT